MRGSLDKRASLGSKLFRTRVYMLRSDDSNAHNVAQGLSAIFGLSLVTKVLSFGLSCLAIPLITLPWYGVHAVHLFVFVTLTSWPRVECFRKVILRLPNASGVEKASRTNMERFSVTMTLAITAVAAVIWWLRPPELIRESSYLIQDIYNISIALHVIASVITAFGERLYLELCFDEMFKEKARLDTFGAIIFAVSFNCPFLVLQWIDRLDLGPVVLLLVSGLSQCIWAFGTMLYTAWVLRQGPLDVLSGIWDQIKFVRAIDSQRRLLVETHKEYLAVEVVTSIQKYIVAEGDKLLMMRYLTPESQGAVSLVQNLASVLLRMFFLPQEDILAIHYSANHISRNAGEWSVGQWKTYLEVFRLVAFVEWSLGLAAALLGPVFSFSVLLFAFGAEAAESQSLLLSRYCVVILGAAFCGVMEGFLNSSGSPEWLRVNQRFTRATWLALNGVAVLVWELQRRTGFSLIGSKDTTVWVWASGLTFLSRAIIPLAMLLHYINRAPKNRGVRDTVKVLFSSNWILMLAVQTALALICRRLPQMSLVERAAVFAPEKLRDRLEMSNLLYCGIAGSIVLILAIRPAWQHQRYQFHSKFV